ncbi:hypothetical protein [Klebsiella aerogenes]|uniref:DUF7946 domain-containing protein n=1 Tax=Klebsiella aerogenes TaxID=548 RepID=UPI001C3E3E60|nr:hypothetical protein [Klebsiella aerogenes]EIV9530140.1 hypothetical protein [Klebsiella aerogenes]MBV6263281.1 hypothetical protein [Klebsiella aerogenes]MBV6281040.1 hypothetical protein [Klebsiella aerogenes]HBY1602568.1 hypothetical protein [Klebsiella aerogenes]HDH0724939.1 hypothetical protein [Klebsiella aerogenes]
MESTSIQDVNFTLRYDGLDAEKHEIELSSLGESLKGFSKILATAGTFALTQKYSRNTSSQEVKIYATEARANCFSLDTVMNFISQSQLFSGSAGAILGALIPYIFAKNAQKKEEMKYLKDALEKAIEALGNKDKDTIEGLISVINKMAGELRPSVRQAVSPIGNTCKKISVSQGNGFKPAVIDEDDKAIIDKLDDDEVLGLREYRIFFTEFDAHRMTAKVIIDGDDSDKRIPAQISDPSASKSDNPYLLSLSRFLSNGISPESAVKVTAKASVRKGAICKLFIVDIEI